MRHFVFLIAIFASLIPELRADEPFFKPGDVVALVGGEDMVVAAELGYLETLIQLALPDHHLKFRSLAREGDTVFEQRRDLNYPKLEDQLDKMGATVVICQFGQMESLAAGAAVDGMDSVDAMDKVRAANGAGTVQGVHKVQAVHEKADAVWKAKVAEFVAAYEKLIGRLKGRDGARRIVIAAPYYCRQESRAFYVAITAFAHEKGYFYLSSALDDFLPANLAPADANGLVGEKWRKVWATVASGDLLVSGISGTGPADGKEQFEFAATLTTLITAKNRLWFHYYRPQNWAFLAGDRTNQPSSRDHLDPSKRWFPEELEKFVPLIDAKDAEIWALAKKLSAGGKN